MLALPVTTVPLRCHMCQLWCNINEPYLFYFYRHISVVALITNDCLCHMKHRQEKLHILGELIRNSFHVCSPQQQGLNMQRVSFQNQPTSRVSESLIFINTTYHTYIWINRLIKQGAEIKKFKKESIRHTHTHTHTCRIQNKNTNSVLNIKKKLSKTIARNFSPIQMQQLAVGWRQKTSISDTRQPCRSTDVLVIPYRSRHFQPQPLLTENTTTTSCTWSSTRYLLKLDCPIRQTFSSAI